ncbi:MAG TPA: ABC transporter ATP-binding protein [Acidimicrobiales bacterium]|nr:ABC transporter ATP-binding protein [Acidimicrobiales bacterium]
MQKDTLDPSPRALAPLPEGGPLDPDAAISVRGLVKRYGDRNAVDGVDLDIRRGEIFALLGPNGAGKTTTLLMCLGTITPDDGSVEIFGHVLPKARSRAMEQVGFAAGYLPLPDRLRVREVLSIFAALCGAPSDEATVRAALDRFGVGHLHDQMCVELSSGQRTIVGIAKAVLHRPALLVLDEPTASLDPDVAHRVRSALQQLNAEDGTTLLVTSHDMNEVERMCERVVFLQHGRVVHDGTPAEILQEHGHASLEDVFLHLAAGQQQPREAS